MSSFNDLNIDEEFVKDINDDFVENEAIFQRLQATNIDDAQGTYIGEPCPAIR